MHKIILVQAVEWEGVYFDGTLIHQDHNIDWEFALRRMAKMSTSPFTFEKQNADEDFLMEHGTLPLTMENC